MPDGTQPDLLPALPWPARLRWQAFRQIERFSTAAEPAPVRLPALPSRPALWVFVSTIGELNAINPFLRLLIERMSERISEGRSGLQLVLLTDRQIYRAAYLAQYPEAEVVEISADNIHAPTLVKIRPPRLFVIAEIPCFPADAPCRLPYGYLYAARQAGAVTALVNGWLYGYEPNCRIDSIERRMLGRDYLQLLDVLCVQNEAVAQALIERGADPAHVHVTGNIKFDALDPQPRPLSETLSPQLLASLQYGQQHSQRPVIVAGCVTDDDERDLVLDAFVLLRQQYPDAALVLAPRHPEQPEVLPKLGAALEQRRLPYRLRSAGHDQAFEPQEVVLVLDTMGELRDFYAVATIAHVGRDHNILEPLAYGKPVTVRPGWDRTYPSYPVFSLAREQGLVTLDERPASLADRWGAAIITQPVDAKAVMGQQRGAAARCLDWFELMFEPNS